MTHLLQSADDDKVCMELTHISYTMHKHTLVYLHGTQHYMNTYVNVFYMYVHMFAYSNTCIALES